MSLTKKEVEKRQAFITYQINVGLYTTIHTPTKQDNESLSWITAFSSILKCFPLIHLLFGASGSGCKPLIFSELQSEEGLKASACNLLYSPLL